MNESVKLQTSKAKTWLIQWKITSSAKNIVTWLVILYLVGYPKWIEKICQFKLVTTPFCLTLKLVEWDFPTAIHIPLSALFLYAFPISANGRLYFSFDILRVHHRSYCSWRCHTSCSTTTSPRLSSGHQQLSVIPILKRWRTYTMMTKAKFISKK